MEPQCETDYYVTYEDESNYIEENYIEENYIEENYTEENYIEENYMQDDLSNELYNYNYDDDEENDEETEMKKVWVIVTDEESSEISEVLSEISDETSDDTGNEISYEISDYACSEISDKISDIWYNKEDEQVAGQQFERLPSSQTQVINSVNNNEGDSGGHSTIADSVMANSTSSNNDATNVVNSSDVSPTNADNSTSLLPRYKILTLSDPQDIEHQHANRNILEREFIFRRFFRALFPQQCTMQTSASSATTTTTVTTSPETSNANISTVSRETLSLAQKANRDQATNKYVTQASAQQRSNIPQVATTSVVVADPKF